MSTNGKEEAAPVSAPKEDVTVLESENTVASDKLTWITKKNKDEGSESSDKKVIGGKTDTAQTTTELFEEEGLGAVSEFVNSKWDPDDLNDGDQVTTPSHTCIRRIKNDIMAIYADPPPGLCVVPDPNNITKIHALITGPFDTPYEGGFFYFLIQFPSDYPINPPRVRLVTTGGGTVRFNPNLYKSGKVCLSILGTWAGPSWSPAQTLSTVLISIQSLMNEKPYHNEPGFKHERTPGDAKHYNNIIQHETIRVAVCDMIDGMYRIPDSLRVFVESSFPDYYHYYLQVCESHSHLDGIAMNDPFGDVRPTFSFKSLIERLKTIYLRIDSNVASGDSDGEEDGEGAHRQVIASS